MSGEKKILKNKMPQLYDVFQGVSKTYAYVSSVRQRCLFVLDNSKMDRWGGGTTLKKLQLGQVDVQILQVSRCGHGWVFVWEAFLR